MSGYKRMRREHQAALLKLEEKCKVEMEAHKAALDKEYDALLHNFTRELERLAVSIQIFSSDCIYLFLFYFLNYQASLNAYKTKFCLCKTHLILKSNSFCLKNFLE